MIEIRYNPSLSYETNQQNFAAGLTKFKQDQNFQKTIGIIGSSTVSELDKIDNFLTTSIKDIYNEAGKYGIVSGGTEGGTPELAINISKRINLPSIGVIPQDGEKYALKDLLDIGLIIPRPIYGDTTWGSETPVLGSIPNAIIVNGGGWGTLVEIGTIMKRNKSLTKHNKPGVPIIFINQSGEIGEMFSPKSVNLPNNELIYSIDSSDQLTDLIIRAIKQ